MDPNITQKYRKQLLGPLAMVLVIAMVVVSCGFFKKSPPPKPPEPPPPPEPARLVLEIEAGGDINPNSKGLPSPLVLRIYQLKSFRGFQSAEFLSLYHEDEAILGKEISNKQVITLIPNEKKTIFIEPDETVRAIGFFAGFRDFEKSQWKAVTSVLPNKFKKVNINISGNRLILF